MTRRRCRSQVNVGWDVASYGMTRPFMDLMKYTLASGANNWADPAYGGGNWLTPAESPLQSHGTGWLTEFDPGDGVTGLKPGHTYALQLVSGSTTYGNLTFINTTTKTGTYKVTWSGWASVSVYGSGISGAATVGWIDPADGGSHSTTFSIDDPQAQVTVQVKRATGNTTTLNDLKVYFQGWETEFLRGDIFAPDFVAKHTGIEILRFMDLMQANVIATIYDERLGFSPTIDMTWFGSLTDRTYWAWSPELLGKLATLCGSDIWIELSTRCTPAVMAAYSTRLLAAYPAGNVIVSIGNEVWNYLSVFADSHHHLHWYWAENIVSLDDVGSVIPKLNFKIKLANNTFQTEPPGGDVSYLNGQQLHLFYNFNNVPSTGLPNYNFRVVYCTLKGGTTDELYLWATSPGVDSLALDGPNITYKAAAANSAASGVAECSIEAWNAFETVFGRSRCIRNVNGQAAAYSSLGLHQSTFRHVNTHTYPEAIGGGSSLGKKFCELLDLYSIAPYCSDYQGWQAYAANAQNDSDQVWADRSIFYGDITTRVESIPYGSAYDMQQARIGVNTYASPRTDIMVGTYEGGPISYGYDAAGDDPTLYPWYLISNVGNNTIHLSSYAYNPYGMSDDLTQYISDGDVLYFHDLPTATDAEATNSHYVTVKHKAGTTSPPEFYIYKDATQLALDNKSTVAAASANKAINFTVARALYEKRITAMDGDGGYGFNAKWFRNCREIPVPSLGIIDYPYDISQYTGMGGYRLWLYQGLTRSAELADSGRLTMFKNIKKLGIGVAGAAAPTYPVTVTTYQFITNPLLTTWTPLPNWNGTPVKVRVIGPGGAGAVVGFSGLSAGGSGANYAESTSIAAAANAPLHVGSAYRSPTSGTYFNAASLAAAHTAGPTLACGASSGTTASGTTGGVAPDPATFDCGDIKFRGGAGGGGVVNKSGGGGAAGPAGDGGASCDGNANGPSGGGGNSGAAPAPAPAIGSTGGNGAASINITTALNSQVATAGGLGVATGDGGDGLNGSGGGATSDGNAPGSGGHGTEFSPVHGSGGGQGGSFYFSNGQFQNRGGYGAGGGGSAWGYYGVGGLIVVEQTLTAQIPTYGTTLDPGNSLTTGCAFWYQLLGNVTTYADASGHNPALIVAAGARQPTVQSTPWGNSICPLSGPDTANTQRTDSSVLTYAGVANLTCSTGDGMGDFSFAFAANPLVQSDAGHPAFGIWDLSVGPGPDGGGFDVSFNGTPASSAATPGSLLIRLGGRSVGPLTPSSCQIYWDNQVDGDFHVWEFELDYATNTAYLLRDGIDQGPKTGGGAIAPLIYLGPTGTTKIWVGNQSSSNNEWAGPDCNLLFIAAWNRKKTTLEKSKMVLATMFDGLI